MATGSLWSASSDRSDGAGAPGPEIEITPEMIEAGALEMAMFDPRVEEREDAVRGIYLAMARVSPQLFSALHRWLSERAHGRSIPQKNRRRLR
jgi:hypothetical protein